MRSASSPPVTKMAFARCISRDRTKAGRGESSPRRHAIINYGRRTLSPGLPDTGLKADAEVTRIVAGKETRLERTATTVGGPTATAESRTSSGAHTKRTSAADDAVTGATEAQPWIRQTRETVKLGSNDDSAPERRSPQQQREKELERGRNEARALVNEAKEAEVPAAEYHRFRTDRSGTTMDRQHGAEMRSVEPRSRTRRRPTVRRAVNDTREASTCSVPLVMIHKLRRLF
jgi:hypothetical protein